mmetsp:Transcript_26301/g.25475  ORF Transcript_26301/g.25475 Transcript_26301/m.25475 type:complete len:92 (+) Transcript_26301:1627-1902(+)
MKFAESKKHWSQFIPQYSSEKELLTLKIKGKNVFEKEKNFALNGKASKPPMFPVQKGGLKSRKNTGEEGDGILWINNHQYNEFGEGEPDSS